MSGAAYQQGFDRGFLDGKSHKPRKPKPAFLKSLLSNAYMAQYSRGYRDGHYAGVRDIRKQEILRVQKAERENALEDRPR